MKLHTILFGFVFVAGAHAASHGPVRNIAHGHVHKARSPKFASAPGTATLSDRGVNPADCDKGALMNKLLLIVPTSLVSVMLAEPTPFHNDNPPEFWTKFDDHEKNCMAALWPVDADQVSAQDTTKEPCTDTTITSTITQTLTVTLPPSPPSPTVTPSTAAGDSSTSTKAPYGNGTATQSPTLSSTGAANSTSPPLPEFTGGQGMVGVSFISTVCAVLVTIAFCIFA